MDLVYGKGNILGKLVKVGETMDSMAGWGRVCVKDGEVDLFVSKGAEIRFT